MRARWGGHGKGGGCGGYPPKVGGYPPEFGGYPDRWRVPAAGGYPPRFGVEGCRGAGRVEGGVVGLKRYEGNVGGVREGWRVWRVPAKGWRVPAKVWRVPAAGTRQDLGWKGAGRVEGRVVGLKGKVGGVREGWRVWRVPAKGWRVPAKVWRLPPLAGTRQDLEWKGAGRVEGRVVGLKGKVGGVREGWRVWRVPAKGWRVPAKVWRVPAPLAGTRQDLEWKGAGRVEGGVVGLKGKVGGVREGWRVWRVPAKGWRVPAKVWRVPAPLAGTRQDLEWKGAGRVEGGVVGLKRYEGKVGGYGKGGAKIWRVPAPFAGTKIWSGRVREGWREE